MAIVDFPLFHFHSEQKLQFSATLRAGQPASSVLQFQPLIVTLSHENSPVNMNGHLKTIIETN